MICKRGLCSVKKKKAQMPHRVAILGELDHEFAVRLARLDHGVVPLPVLAVQGLCGVAEGGEPEARGYDEGTRKE